MEYFIHEKTQKVARLTVLIRSEKSTNVWSGELSIGLDPWGSAYLEELKVSIDGEAPENVIWFYWMPSDELECRINVNKTEEGVYSVTFKELGPYGTESFVQWFKLNFKNWPLRIGVEAKVRVGSTVYHLIYNNCFTPPQLSTETQTHFPSRLGTS